MVTKGKRDESWARRTVARRLGRDGLPDRVWERAFDDDNYLHIVTWGGDVEREGVISEIAANARRVIEEAYAIVSDLGDRPRATPARPEVQATPMPQPDLTPVLDAHERDRARVFSLSLAAAAERARATHHPEDRTPRVQGFRDAWFGGRVLTSAEAWSFVRSPAVATLTPVQFRDYGIPALAHSARADHPAPEWDEGNVYCRRFLVMVDPPGRTFVGSERRRPGTDLSLPSLDVPVRPSEGARIRRRGDGELVGIERIEYWPRSLMDTFGQLAAWLAGRFPWEPEDAVWFVLTGEAPSVDPLAGRVEVTHAGDWTRATISLTADAWVSPKSVEAAFRQERRALLGNRPLRSEEGLSLWLFREEERQRAGRPLKDREVWRQWKAAHPDDPRYPDPSPFYRALDRGERLARQIGPPRGRRLADPPLPSDIAPVDWDAIDFGDDEESFEGASSPLTTPSITPTFTPTAANNDG